MTSSGCSKSLRDKNEKIDKLAKLASSTVENLNLGIFMENFTKLSIKKEEGKEVNMASLEPE